MLIMASKVGEIPVLTVKGEEKSWKMSPGETLNQELHFSLGQA